MSLGHRVPALISRLQASAVVLLMGQNQGLFSDLLMLSSTWEIALPVQWFLKTFADFHHLTKAVIFALLLWSSIDLDIQLTHLN